MAETENNYVKPISKDDKEAIINASVQSLGARPTSNATEMKKRFVQPVVNLDNTPCLADEVDRVAIEADGAIASLNEEMPLVLTTTQGFGEVAGKPIPTAESFTAKDEAGNYTFKGVDGYHSIGVEQFNKSPEKGDVFWGTAVLGGDNSIVSFTAKVTGIVNDKVTYTLEDATILHNGKLDTTVDDLEKAMPLVISVTLNIQADITQGYRNSLSASLFNKPAKIGEKFWFTNVYDKTVKSVVAKITGALNDKGFYPFEVISVVVLHDGALDGAVATLQERMDTAESDIDKLEGDVSSNNKQITALQNRLDTFSLYEIVDSLPTTDIDANKLYLVPATSTEDGNILEEWLWANNKWELVGTKKVDIDLTPYAKKDEVIAKTDRGKENGVASLGADGKIPKAQLPNDLIFGENGLSEEWKLIGETMVTPDADGGLPKGVYFSSDNDSKPFKLKRAKAVILTDTTKGDVYTTGTASIQMKWNDQPDKWNRATWVDGLPTVENKYAKVVFDIEVVDRVAYATAVADKGLAAYSNPQYATRVQLYGGLGVTLATEWIEEIGIDTYSDHFTEGTRVLLYGIPADAASGGGSGSSLPEGFNPDDYVKNDELDDKLKDYVKNDENNDTKLYRHYVYLSETMVSDGHRYKYLVFESLSYEKFVYSPDDSLLLLDVKQLSKVYGLRLETEADEDGNAFSMPILRVVASYEENDNSIAVVFVEAEQDNVITLWTDTEIGYVGDMNYTVQEL